MRCERTWNDSWSGWSRRVFLVDPMGRMLMAGHNASKLLGVPPDALRQEMLFNVVPRDSELGILLSYALQSGNPIRNRVVRAPDAGRDADPVGIDGAAHPVRGRAADRHADYPARRRIAGRDRGGARVGRAPDGDQPVDARRGPRNQEPVERDHAAPGDAAPDGWKSRRRNWTSSRGRSRAWTGW